MARLPDDVSLTERCEQLFKAVEQASLHVDLAAKELDVIRSALGARMEFMRRVDQDDDDLEQAESVLTTMQNLAVDSLNELIGALEFLQEAVISDEDEDEGTS